MQLLSASETHRAFLNRLLIKPLHFVTWLLPHVTNDDRYTDQFVDNLWFLYLSELGLLKLNKYQLHITQPLHRRAQRRRRRGRPQDPRRSRRHRSGRVLGARRPGQGCALGGHT